MRSIPALYHEGQVTFPFTMPDTDKPVAVLIIFPDDASETDDDCPPFPDQDEMLSESEIPY